MVTPLQLSLTVTVAGTGKLVQFTVVLAGTPLNNGPVTSITVITCEALVELPHTSVAVQVLVMV
jgi:hypothetical protein